MVGLLSIVPNRWLLDCPFDRTTLFSNGTVDLVNSLSFKRFEHYRTKKLSFGRYAVPVEFFYPLKESET